jgi:hypothetical protein
MRFEAKAFTLRNNEIRIRIVKESDYLFESGHWIAAPGRSEDWIDKEC